MTPHVGERLSAFVDGALAASEAASVAAHVRSCAECARILEEYGALDGLAREESASAPAQFFEAFPTRVRSRLEAQTLRPQRRLPHWAWAAAAALALAAVIPLTLRAPHGQLPSAQDSVGPSSAERAPVAAAPTAGPGRDRGGAESAADRPQRVMPSIGNKSDALKREADRQLDARRPGSPKTVGGIAAPQAAPPPTPSRPAEAGGFAGPAAPPAPEAPVPPAPLRAGEPAKAGAEGVPAGADFAAAERPRTEQEAVRARAASAVEKKGKAESAERMTALGFSELENRSAETAEAARRLREAWRRLAHQESDPRRADEARVRVAELGALAYRLGGEREDAALARADAEAYLGRADAAQGPRVRALLDALPR
jgi:negative regulator of sigma E activity